MTLLDTDSELEFWNDVAVRAAEIRDALEESEIHQDTLNAMRDSLWDYIKRQEAKK